MYNEGIFCIGLYIILVTLISGIPISTVDVYGQLQVPISETITVSNLVKEVNLTAVNVTESNRVVVSLSYNGSGSSPAVTLIGTAINLNPEDVSSLMSSFLQGSGSTTTANATQTSPIQLPSSFQILTGSNVMEAGWKSPASVTVPLQGNTTLNEANFISVQIIPFTG